MPPADPNAP